MVSESTRLATEEMQKLLASAQQASAFDPATFTVANQVLQPQQVIEVLDAYLTQERRHRIQQVLNNRTYTVATVVEGLVNTGNVSAVMRSAEAMGFQAFHVITPTPSEGEEVVPFKNSVRVSRGAEKWLDVHHWTTPTECIHHLKDQGYQVVATHLDERAVSIAEIDFTEPTALIFGNELRGVSPTLLKLADRTCIVPMQGFTQSFNISVAAALCLYHAVHDRLARQGFHGDLSEAQYTRLYALYLIKSVRHARKILARSLQQAAH